MAAHAGQVDEDGASRLERAKTIKGELLRVEYGEYVVKEQDGKEVRLTTDKMTQMMGQLKKGDRIEAKVNDQNHALSIRSAQ
jgi:transcriptional antiterminator Rof (Rho-off)